MKILFDLTDLYDHLSGIERYAMELSLAMIKNHPEQDYILLFKNEVPEAYESLLVQKNVKHYILHGKNKLVFRLVRLPQVLYRLKADAYVFLAFPQPFDFFHKNVYTAVHDMTCFDVGDSMKFASKWFYRISTVHSLLFSKGILTISKFSAKRICYWAKRMFGKLEKKIRGRITIVYCGIDAKFGSDLISDEDREKVRKKYSLPEKYILSLSTLEPRKNLGTLVKAYANLWECNSDIPNLVLAGRTGWKMEDFISERQKGDKLKTKITLPGFIEDEDLMVLYDMADLFIFPSVYEGFGLPPLEAMAMGTAVLSSDTSSLPEVLGDAAYYYSPKDTMKLTEVIEGLLTDNSKDSVEQKEKRIARAKRFQWNQAAEVLLKKLQAEVGH